ncbi:unnamed protein product [Rotaria sordida]|uniref:Chorein N-terminal domain-containing protein n=1 Tax=Rotaria sordida TaxID=392033 RepID=A0A813QQS0_9BILA|nr:unnamed protein product [Rotaria sordida]
MVLKGIIRYIINRYLKNYIEQLDDEKLNFDLRHGHVTLGNLRLKPEALADLNLPVTVAVGYLEKLALTIPWRNLHTHSTKVHIDGLYILIVPKNEFGQDLTEYHTHKMRRVQRKVDDLRKAMIENKKLDEKEMTFFERMRLQIMQNIELVVENLHISYETKSTTKLGHPFSFGVTLHYLKLTTGNDIRTRHRTKEIMPIIYTLKEINSVSIYWNTRCESRVSMPFNIVVDDLKSKIVTTNSEAKDNEMSYILYPVDVVVNMVIMITPGEHGFDRSTFNINAVIKQMALHIDLNQFSDVFDFGKFQNYSTLYERCREYRQLHLQESLDDTMLTQEQKDRIKILESKLDVFNLAYIRHSVEIEIQNKIMADSSFEHIHKNNYHRWNSWWRKKHKHNHDDRKMSITTSESYHDDGFSFYFEDLSNIIIDITINKLDLNLVSSLRINTACSSQLMNKVNREILAQISVDDAKINAIKRSISSSLLFQLTFPYFRFYGIQNNITNSRLLVQPISKCHSPLMYIQFELFPINRKRSDYRFHLNIQPIRFFYDAETFNRIAECFEQNVNLNSFLLSEIKHRTNAEMEFDLSCQKVFDLTIELKKISIIFPENGFYKENCSLIHIDFSQLILKSCLDENQIASQAKLNEEHFYVKYKLAINDLRMLYFNSDGSYLNLLQKIPLIDIDFFKCIYSDDAILDDWHIHLKMNLIREIQISNKIFQIIIDHFKSIPQFNSTISEILYRINLAFEIFRANASLKGSISIDSCLLIILINPLILIETNLYISISKTRNNIQKIIVILKNLTMKTKKLSHVFYLNKHLQLNYTNNSTRLQLTDQT